MARERVEVFELLAPLEREGPGQLFRARAGEGPPDAPRPVAPGTEVLLRVVTPSEAGGARALAALEQAHAALGSVPAGGAAAASLALPLASGREGRGSRTRFWSASPWVEGRTLEDLLREVEVLPDALTNALAQQLAGGLAALETALVPWTGIAPGRVLLREDSSVVLLDPGFGPAVPATWPTRGGPVPGTLRCAAPEVVARGSGESVREDLYGLGALLFRCMTGRWHRPGDDSRRVREQSALPGDHRPGAVRPVGSLFLDEVVRTLLRSDPTERFPSAAALVRALEERRAGEWWKGLGIVEESVLSHAGPERERAEAEPPAPALPKPAPAPDEDWVRARRARPAALGSHPCPLVGLDPELEGLLDAAVRLPERGGEAVLLQGGAGAGKTRLLAALAARLESLPAAARPLLLHGSHRRLGIGRPHGAFGEALARFLADGREVEPRAVAWLLGDATGIAPAFAAFLSGNEPPEGASPLRRETLTFAFAQSLRTLCESGPVVLAVEDLQWADPEGLDLFGFLARWCADVPLLLVGSHRAAPEGSSLAPLLASLRQVDHVSRTRIHPLEPVQTRVLVGHAMADAEDAAALAHPLHERSGGVPLLILESLRALAAEGALERGEDGRFRPTPKLAGTELPRGTEEVFRRRLAGLEPRERGLLDAGAVQGGVFDVLVATRALHRTAEEVQGPLASLVGRGLLEVEGPVGRFTSHSLFDAVHDALADATLGALHAATAAAFVESRNPAGLPADAVHGIVSYRAAWHGMLSTEPERGLPYVDAAAAHLRATWRLGAGERLSAIAVGALSAEPGRSAELVEMLLRRAEFLGLQGRRHEQRELLDEALLRSRSAREPAREARVLLESARLHYVTIDLERARHDGRESLSLAHRAEDRRGEARAHFLLGNVAFRESRYQDARNHLRASLDLARQLADEEAEGEALHALGAISQGVGSYDHAEELQRRAVAIYRRSGDLARECEALTSLGQIASAAGEPERAEEQLRRALAISRALADGYGETRALGHLGLVLQDSGRLRDARAAHAECLARSRELGARHNEIVALLNVATTEHTLARFDEARDAYGDALRAAREIRDERLQGYALTGLGEVARQRGEVEVARNLFERAVRHFRRAEDPPGLAGALLAAGRMQTLSGRPSEGYAFLAEAREAAAGSRARQVAALATGYLALLRARAGSPEDADRLLADAESQGLELRRSDAARVELRFVRSLALRVLRRRELADRALLESERRLQRALSSLTEEDRARVLAESSPQREIAAGAAALRAAGTPLDVLSD